MEAGKGRSRFAQERPKGEDCSSRSPAPDQQKDAQEANRQTTQDHAKKKAAGSVQGREPSDKSRRCALSQHEEVQAEPQGTGLGSTQRGEYTQ